MKDRYLSYHVIAQMDGKTVEQVARRVFGISSSLLKSMKRSAGISLNEKPCRTIDIIHTGDVLHFNIADEGCSDIIPNDFPLPIVYEDEDIILLDKPEKISMHPCLTEREGTVANAIVSYLLKQGENAVFHPVNRLDKDTSGLCLIAKNRYSHCALSKQIQSQTLRRRYYAIVRGIPSPSVGKIEKPIAREVGSVLKRVVSEEGQRAVTNYKTVLSCKDYSLLDISLESGRTHQIRVHFSHASCPLLGNWLYGNGDEERVIFPRHALHSYFIIFRHPVKGTIISFQSPLPKDMSDFVQNHF